MLGVRANSVVIDETQLTRRIHEQDVKATLLDFNRRKSLQNEYDVDMIVSTTEETELRASLLLDLFETALKRLFGDLKFNISVLTSQSHDTSKIRVSARAVKCVAVACGLCTNQLPRLDLQIEDFVSNRISTEYLLARLSFQNSDILENPSIEITLNPSGRILTVQRSQRFR